MRHPPAMSAAPQPTTFTSTLLERLDEPVSRIWVTPSLHRHEMSD
jgi:hypothetical protein